MSEYRRQVEASIAATVIHSSTTFSWFGHRSDELLSRVRRALPPEAARNYLRLTLQRRLYDDFYLRGFATPALRSGSAVSVPANAGSFVEMLSRANDGQGHWQGGWRLVERNDDEVVVCKDGLELRAQPRDVLAANDAPSRSSDLALRYPKELLGFSPGFYVAIGDSGPPRQASRETIRVYWHLTPLGAIEFVRRATAALNRATVPFRLKVASDPTHFDRCDPVVVYVAKRDYGAAVRALGRIHRHVAMDLQENVPALTKRLSLGVGLAEDPGRDESFGMHRCGLIADAVIAAYQRGIRGLEERLELVEESFATLGLDLDYPFLNAGSRDDYEFSPPVRRSSRRSEVGRTTGSRVEFVDVAATIGNTLAHEAVWHRGRCTWIDSRPGDETFGIAALPYGPMRGDIYAGTSGVALFLADLHAVTGDRGARETAIGAMRHALAEIESPSPATLGVYLGWPGVALAAARAGCRLGSERLVDHAAKLCLRASKALWESEEFDLLGGTAGAIVALLGVHSAAERPALLDIAARLGADLVAAADKAGPGYAWQSPREQPQIKLTGLSHGAAGAAVALLELFAASGESAYREAAERAFEFERHWFDRTEKNWPDFRGAAPEQVRDHRSLRFVTLWCHGAAGIGLSRVRGYQLLGDETLRTEAETALETTQRSVRDGIQSGFNFCLCHGLSGHADALLYGAEVLGRRVDRLASLAHEVGEAGIEAYAHGSRPWPCGKGGIETPSLMLGLAGIGHFYLRLHDAGTPMVTLFRPEDLGSAGRRRDVCEVEGALAS